LVNISKVLHELMSALRHSRTALDNWEHILKKDGKREERVSSEQHDAGQVGRCSQGEAIHFLDILSCNGEDVSETKSVHAGKKISYYYFSFLLSFLWNSFHFC